MRVATALVFASLLSTTLGCAPARAVRGEPAAPAPATPDASYVLSLRRAPKPILTIALTVRASSSRLVIGCEDWGGVEHCEHEIGPVTAQDDHRRALAVHVSDRKWAVDATPGELVTFEYALTPSKPAGSASEEDRYYPMVSDTFLHFIGHIGLLVPDDAAGIERNIAIRWRGFREEGWNVACSFGTDLDVTTRRSYASLAHSVFVAGDYRIVRVPESGVSFAIRPGAWSFGADDFVSTAMPIITEERRLFREGASPLLVVAAPRDVDGDFIHGTMLTDSIDVFLPRAGRKMPAPLLGLLLAHEYFHNWDTLVMRVGETEGAAIYWFTEGFAEFYMRRIAYRAGRITRRDYLSYLNSALHDYFSSPVNRMTNDRIASDFWKSADVNRLPYNRGQIIALLIDVNLRKKSGGAKSLDDLVRALVANVKATGAGVTTESVLREIGDMTSPEIEAAARRIVIDGDLAVVPDDALAPCAVRKPDSDKIPQFEFAPDGDASCATTL